MKRAVTITLLLLCALCLGGAAERRSTPDTEGYTLHADFYYHFPKWRYARVNVVYLKNFELAKLLGISETSASMIKGCQPHNNTDIYINTDHLFPRLPYSLDPSIHRVHEVVTHEGVHVAQRYFSPTDCTFLTKMVEIEWSEEPTPDWIRGLLQRGYLNWDYNTWQTYYKILWMEAMAWFLQTGGYYVRNGWPPRLTIKKISELPPYMRSYAKSIEEMMRRD